MVTPLSTFNWCFSFLHSCISSRCSGGLLYGSYKRPRELIWVIGMAIYLVLMAEGFMGMYFHGDKCLIGELM